MSSRGGLPSTETILNGVFFLNSEYILGHTTETLDPVTEKTKTERCLTAVYKELYCKFCTRVFHKRFAHVRHVKQHHSKEEQLRVQTATTAVSRSRSYRRRAPHYDDTDDDDDDTTDTSESEDEFEPRPSKPRGAKEKPAEPFSRAQFILPALAAVLVEDAKLSVRVVLRDVVTYFEDFDLDEPPVYVKSVPQPGPSWLEQKPNRLASSMVRLQIKKEEGIKKEPPAPVLNLASSEEKPIQESDFEEIRPKVKRSSVEPIAAATTAHNKRRKTSLPYEDEPLMPLSRNSIKKEKSNKLSEIETSRIPEIICLD